MGHCLKKLLTRKDILAKCIQFLLQLFANIYNIIIVARNILFCNGLLKQSKVKIPVISLGNITTGGTGKTPAVIWLVQQILLCHYRHPIILSRGYGGDEAKIFQNRLPHVPHIINSKRVIGAKQAIEVYGTNICILLDDGMQHRYLARDCDIVLIDAIDPFGGNHVLPRGFLRESKLSLERADIICITRSTCISKNVLEELKFQIQKFTRAKIYYADHVPTFLRNFQTGEKISIHAGIEKKILAFCGLGNPEGFQATLKQIGYSNYEWIHFPDHHAYSLTDIQNITNQKNVEILITTEKDAVKLEKYMPLLQNVWILEIEFQLLSSRSEFMKHITASLNK